MINLPALRVAEATPPRASKKIVSNLILMDRRLFDCYCFWFSCLFKQLSCTRCLLIYLSQVAELFSRDNSTLYHWPHHHINRDKCKQCANIQSQSSGVTLTLRVLINIAGWERGKTVPSESVAPPGSVSMVAIG